MTRAALALAAALPLLAACGGDAPRCDDPEMLSRLVADSAGTGNALSRVLAIREVGHRATPDSRYAWARMCVGQVALAAGGEAHLSLCLRGKGMFGALGHARSHCVGLGCRLDCGGITWPSGPRPVNEPTPR